MKTCRKLAALVAALTLTMVPLAGCGGGGTESSGTTGSAAGADKEALIKSEPSSISFLALDYDESKTVDSSVEMAVQVGGKLRATVTVAVDSTQDAVVQAAMANEKIANLAQGKQLVKVIHVPNKLVNLILK